MRKAERRLPAPLHRHLPHVRDASILLGGSGDAELRRLTDQAFDLKLKGSPYLIDACAAIEEWHDRRHLRAAERRDARHAELIRALKETDPARIIQTRRAA